MNPSTTPTFEEYLSQLRKREQQQRRKFQLGVIMAGGLLFLGGLMWYSPTEDPRTLRQYESSSLNYSVVKNLFELGSDGILVTHPAIGTDTISSPEDYRVFKELLNQIDHTSSSQASPQKGKGPLPYAVDIAGAREEGSSLVFSIENPDQHLTYLLDFGNGYRRELHRTIRYTYDRAGDYRIRLITTNEEGMSSIYNKSIRILSQRQPVTTGTDISSSSSETEQPELSSGQWPGPEHSQSTQMTMRGQDISPPQPEWNDVISDSLGASPPIISSTEPRLTPEVPPQFPGGLSALSSFIRKNYRYPRQAQHSRIEGKVYVQFIVQLDGSLSQPRVIRGIGGGCDEEALRLLSLMPNWIPARQSGEPIATYHTIPISFRLFR